MKWRRVRQETSPDQKTATQSSVAAHRNKKFGSPRIDQPGSPNGRPTLTAPTIRKSRANGTRVTTERSPPFARGDVKSVFHTRLEDADERFSRLPAWRSRLEFLQTLSQGSNRIFYGEKAQVGSQMIRTFVVREAIVRLRGECCILFSLLFTESHLFGRYCETPHAAFPRS